MSCAVEGEDNIIGREGRAVMEFDPFPQLEPPRCRVRLRPFDSEPIEFASPSLAQRKVFASAQLPSTRIPIIADSPYWLIRRSLFVIVASRHRSFPGAICSVQGYMLQRF